MPVVVLVGLSLLTLALSLILMQRLICIRRYWYSVPAVFYLFYLAFIYAGSLVVYWQHPGPARGTYLLAVHAVLILLPLGMALASRLFHFRPSEEMAAYLDARVESPEEPLFGPFVVFAIMSVALSLIYLAQLPSIPVLDMLRLTYDYASLARAREAATGLFPGNYYLYSLSFNVFLPFLTYLAWSHLRLTHKRRYRVLFWFLLVFTCFMLVSSLQKAPVAMFLLGLLLLSVIALRQVSISRTVFLLLLGFLIPTVIMLLVTWQSQTNLVHGALASANAMLSRIFTGQTTPLYHYFEVFPAVHPFVRGATIRPLAAILGIDFFSASRFVHAYTYPNRVIQLGSSNSAFIADMYANYGFTVMLVTIVFVGFVLQAVQIFLVRTRKTSISLALYAFLCIAFAKLSQVALTVTLSSFGVIWVFLIILYFQASARLFRTVYGSGPTPTADPPRKPSPGQGRG